MSNILIVDDEPCILEILTYWLTEQGHQITCASSGEEVIQLLPTVNPDLVLTDIRMGPGNGFQVLMAAKRHDPLVAVIMMTGHLTTPKDGAEAMKLGADDYLYKPFQLSDLDRRIEYALKYRHVQQIKKSEERGERPGNTSAGACPICG